MKSPGLTHQAPKSVPPRAFPRPQRRCAPSPGPFTEMAVAVLHGDDLHFEDTLYVKWIAFTIDIYI